MKRIWFRGRRMIHVQTKDEGREDLNTQFLLMARYDGLAIIPLDRVCKDYFPHLSEQRLIARIQSGEIRLPIVRTDPGSQKASRGVPLTDLAAYIDTRFEAARKELRQIAGAG